METLLTKRPDLFQILTIQFALLTFTVLALNNSREANNALTIAVLDRLNAEGKVLMTQTQLRGITVIRFAPGSPWTESHHVQEAFNLIVESVERLRYL